MSRESSMPRALPPMLNGWHGGPPATRSMDPKSENRTSRASPLVTCQCLMPGMLSRSAFATSVSHAGWFHSMSASWSNPARCEPRASPPAPVKSSMDRNRLHGWDSSTPASESCLSAAEFTDYSFASGAKNIRATLHMISGHLGTVLAQQCPKRSLYFTISFLYLSPVSAGGR